MSLSAAILATWRRPYRVVAALLQQERNEGRLLVFLLVALGLIFLAQIPRLERAASAEVPFEALLVGALFALLMLAPVLFYLLALVLTGLLRLIAPVEGYAVRFALFWALFSTAPLVLAQAAVDAMFGLAHLTLAVGIGIFVLFVVILGVGISAALAAAKRSA